MIQDIEIKKIPYLYTSPYLFNQFLILGYTEEEKKRELIPQIDNYLSSEEFNLQDKTQEQLIYSIKNTLNPSIISSIALNEKYNILNSSTIINFCFPHPPKLYFVPNESTSIAIPSNDYSVIFFISFDPINSVNKKYLSYGFCDIIYEPIKCSTNGIYHIPKAHLFISNYPYFSHFYSLSKEIANTMSNTQMPIEIIIYNIINNTPRTISGEMTLSWFPDNFYLNNLTLVTKSSFEPLSGYPILDLNCVELFSILSLDLIIEIVLLNVLEYDMLFFSKNIEMLNLFMYIFSVLNYPFTDTIYLWHICSVSKEELFNEDYNSKFIGKPNSSMIGVNCEYNENINTDSFALSLFIVDLDRQRLKFKSNDSDTESTKNVISFLNYITSIIETREKPKNQFESNLLKLIKEIEVVATKIIINNTRGKRFIPEFYKVNESILKKNKVIQEIFYSFMINLIKPIYSKTLLKSNALTLYSITKDYNQNYIEEEKEKKDIHDEEMLFYELFRNSVKYNHYIINFFGNHKCFDCYQISLLFFEEFLQLNHSIDNEYSFKHFDIIDSFFNPNSSINTKQNLSKVNEISVCKYSTLIRKKYRHSLVFANGQSIQFFQSKKNQPEIKTMKAELNQSIINSYTSILNNLDISIKSNCFPIIETEIPVGTYSDVTNCIEYYLYKNKIMTAENLVSISFIIMSSILYPLLSLNQDSFTSLFKYTFELLKNKTGRLMRKYINLLLTLYYYQAQIQIKQNKEYKNLLIAFHALLELIYTKKIYPNVELSTLIKKFSQIDIETDDYHQFIVFEELFADEDDPKDKTNCSAMSESANEQVVFKNYSMAKISPNISPSTSTNQIETQDKSYDSNIISKNKLNVTPPELSLSQFYNRKQNNTMMYIINNSCKDGVKREGFVLQTIYNTNFEADLLFICNKCDKYISPKIVMKKYLNDKVSEFTSEIFSPLKLFNVCSQILLPKWISSDKTVNDLDKTLLRKAMLSFMLFQLKVNTKNKFPLIDELFID